MGRFSVLRRSLRHLSTPRHVAMAFCVLVAAVSWGVKGGSVLLDSYSAALNDTQPAATLDVWVSPPEATQAKPIVVSAPDASFAQKGDIAVPQGSVISAHYIGPDGAPILFIDAMRIPFEVDAQGGYQVTRALHSGGHVSVRQGWTTLGAWHMRVIPDAPPHIALSGMPMLGEGTTLRLAFKASDEFGLSAVALRLTPLDPPPGCTAEAVDIALPAPTGKEVERVESHNLSENPWAGQKVRVQVIATNQIGRRSSSEGFDITLPEKRFQHPIARVLIEERRKLMLHPDDERLRDETANIMAGIAHQTSNYHGDPVVLMALRSGAVRLVLGHDHDAAVSVNDILWQAATRIEGGVKKHGPSALRDMREDLAGLF